MGPIGPLPGSPPGRPTEPGPVRGNRNFGFYLGSTTASWAGLGVADVLILWLVFSQTGSTLAVAAVGVVETIPPIAIGYFAGALADRHSRRGLLLVTSAAQAIVLGLIPVSLRTVGFQLGIVLALAFALEMATVIAGLAATAILPGLVDSDGLDGANALTQAFSSVAWAVGAAAAAGLLVLTDPAVSFGANFVVFGLGAVLVALIVRPTALPPADAEKAEGAGVRQQFSEGVRFLRGHGWLWRFTVVAVATGFFVTMFSPYLVVFTVEGLALPPSYFGYLAGGYSAGFFVGSLLTARFRVVHSFGLWLGVALLGSGGLLGLLVLVPNFSVDLVAFAGMGALMGLVITGSITLVQRVVPSELLGRYLGLQETLVWVVAPFGVATGGVLIEMLGVREGFGIAAAGLALVGVVTVASPRLRSIGVPPKSGATPGGGPSVAAGSLDGDGRVAQTGGQSPTLVDEIRA
jgi:MFS family permease